MRTPESETELRLQDELKVFHAQFSGFQGTTGETRRERFEQPLDRFALRWEDRLNDLEIAELRGCRTAANQLVDGRAREEKLENNRRTFDAIKNLDPETRDLIWNSTDKSDAPSTVFANDRKEQANDVYEKGRAVIQERYADLRAMLLASVQEMAEGREPRLDEKLAKAADRIEEPNTLEEYRRRRAGTAQDAETQILETQELQRSIS